MSPNINNNLSPNDKMSPNVIATHYYTDYAKTEGKASTTCMSMTVNFDVYLLEFVLRIYIEKKRIEANKA